MAAKNDLDPREIILASLYQRSLTGEGLSDLKGPSSAGNIGRALFDRGVDELRSLGMSTFNGEAHAITDRGLEFFEQRFELAPVRKGLTSFSRRSGSHPLPAMSERLRDELAGSRRAARVLAYASVGVLLALILLIVGFAINAQTH